MRRSSLALIAIVLIIAGAVVLLLRQVPEPPVFPEGPTPTTATDVAPAPTVEPAKPTTATAAKPTTATPAKPSTAAPADTTPAKPTEPEKPEPPTAEAVLKAAETALAANKPADAMKALSDALAHAKKPDDTKAIKTRLAKLAADALFSPKPCPPLSVIHEVAAGDSLWQIARKHKTTVELIQRINGMKNDAIRVGQRLKIIPGGFDVEVVKSQFRLTLTKNGVWVREFKVGLGKDGSTPVGSFVANHKLKQPTYFGNGAPVPFEDRKNNPLGTRWITIKGAGAGQYGIHGTWEPESMGKEESKGCVRMLNNEVEWLFDLIVPGDSKIVIKP